MTIELNMGNATSHAQRRRSARLQGQQSSQERSEDQPAQAAAGEKQSKLCLQSECVRYQGITYIVLRKQYACMSGPRGWSQIHVMPHRSLGLAHLGEVL